MSGTMKVLLRSIAVVLLLLAIQVPPALGSDDPEAAPPFIAPGVSVTDGSGAVDTAVPGDDTRPLLAPPLSTPSGAPERLDTERRPDAIVRRDGVKLELWVPPEPIEMGTWLTAVMRVTNVGQRTLRHQGRVQDDCSPPATTSLDLGPLFDGGIEQRDNRAKLKRIVASRWPLRMGMEMLEGSTGEGAAQM